MLSKPKILVCTDFSDCSDNALKAAEEIRKKSNGELYVLNVVNNPYTDTWISPETLAVYVGTTFEQNMIDEAKAELKKQIDRTAVKAEGYTLTGLPYERIMSEIERKNYDFVVIGYSGKSGRKFIGGLTTKLASTCHKPLMVIKKESSLSNVAALVDPEGEMKNIILWAEEFSFLFSTQMCVMSFLPNLFLDISNRMSQPRDEFLAMTKAFYETELVRTENKIKANLSKQISSKIIINGYASTTLTEQMISTLYQEKVELAVMQRHQKKIIEKIFLGSITRKMLDFFTGNILILPS